MSDSKQKPKRTPQDDTNTNTSQSQYIQRLDLSDFNPEFHSFISYFSCPLCKGITYKPVMDLCGHFYCEECFATYIRTSNICPVDNTTELRLDNLRTNSAVNSAFLTQIVQCKNRIRHCEWKGLVKDLEAHLNIDCLKQFVPCANKECNESICRESLQEHLKQCEYRMEICNDCKAFFPFNQLKAHYDVCPKANITCPQKCGVNILREELKGHITDKCMYTVVPCPFAELGCKVTMMKKEMDLHLDKQILGHCLNMFDVVKKISKDYEIMYEGFNKRFLKLETPGLYKAIPYQSRISQMSLVNDQGVILKIDDPFARNLYLTQANGVNNSIYNGNNNHASIGSMTPLNQNCINIDDEEDKPSNQPAKSIQDMITCKEDKELLDLSVSFSEDNDDDNNNNPNTNNNVNPNLNANTNTIININENNNNNKDKDKDKERDKDIDINGNVEMSPIRSKAFFNTELVPKGISISKNQARSIIISQNEHKYVFINYTIRENSKAAIHEWRFVINPSSKWIGLGLCNKDEVVRNHCKFYSTHANFKHNTFCVSTNGYLWNSANNAENNCQLPNFPKITQGDSINFTYYKSEKVLEFKVENTDFIGKLTQVASKTLTPCILFLHSNDEVEVYFKSNNMD